MSRIKIDTDGIQSVKAQIRQQEQKMQEIGQTIANVAANLDIQIAATEKIEDRLSALCKNCNFQQEQMAAIDMSLSNVIDDFMRTDAKITQQTNELNYLMKHIGMVNRGLVGSGTIIDSCASGALNRCFGITDEGQASVELAMDTIQKYIDSQAAFGGKVSVEGEALYNYLQNNDCTRLFGQYNFSFTFLNDLNYWDTFLYSSQKWKNALASIFCGGGFTDKTYEMFTNDPDECKALLRNIIDDLCETDYIDVLSGDDSKAIGIVKGLAKAAGCNDVADLTEKLNKYIGNLETADKILKDYSTNVAMLESLKDLAPDSSVLSDTIDSLVMEYENQVAFSLFDKLKSEAEKGAVELADVVLGSNIMAVDKVLQGVFNDVPQVDAINTLIYTTNLSSGATNAFWQAADKIQSGNFTEANLAAYKNSFNLVKALKIEEYNGMLSYYESGSREAQYLSNQISQLESMTYNKFNYATDYANFKLVSASSTGSDSSGGGGF